MAERFLAPPVQKPAPVIPADKPVYRVLTEQGFFGPDDTLYPMGSLIVLYDDPNEDMEPMNELARANLEKALEKLEESARKVAEFNGRYFAARPRSKEEMISNASEDARRVRGVNSETGTAIMGAKLDTSKRIQALTDTPAPDTGRKTSARARIETIG